MYDKTMKNYLHFIMNSTGKGVVGSGFVTLKKIVASNNSYN